MRNLPRLHDTRSIMEILDDMRKLSADILTPTWAESFTASRIPADGTIIHQTETVMKKYKVKYQDDGTISYIPIKETKDDKQERISD